MSQNTTLVKSDINKYKVSRNYTSTCIDSGLSVFTPKRKAAKTCVSSVVLPAAGQNLLPETDVFTPLLNQTNFILSFTPENPEKFMIFDVNGHRRIYATDFTVSGNTLTYLEDSYILEPTDIVQITYFHK